MAKPQWGTFSEARARVLHMWYMCSLYMLVSVNLGCVHYMWVCVDCACVVYVHACGMVCVCVSTWGMYICVCVCVCVCVVMWTSVFVWWGAWRVVWWVWCVFVCVICSVCLCTWWTSACGGVCAMCIGLRMCCAPLCVYLYVYLRCACLFLCVWCWVGMSISLCVWLCFYVCVFTPAWGLQPHSSRSGALLSDLSIPLPEYRAFLGTHGLGSVSRESGKALPVVSVYKSAQLCAWVCDMPPASAEDRCLWLLASRDLRKSLSQAPERLNSWENVFPLRPYFHSSLKEKNILGDSISHSD